MFHSLTIIKIIFFMSSSHRFLFLLCLYLSNLMNSSELLFYGIKLLILNTFLIQLKWLPMKWPYNSYFDRIVDLSRLVVLLWLAFILLSASSSMDCPGKPLNSQLHIRNKRKRHWNLLGIDAVQVRLPHNFPSSIFSNWSTNCGCSVCSTKIWINVFSLQRLTHSLLFWTN